MQATIATIARVQREAGITDTSLLNYVVSDGSTLIATRYVSNDSDPAASLYYAGAARAGGRGMAHRQPGCALQPEAAAAAVERSCCAR